MGKDDKLIILCECNSMQHQAMFWKCEDEDFPFLEVDIHLTTHRGFWKRLLYGLKYAFGHTSNYGAWDSFLFNKETEERLYLYLKDRYELIDSKSKSEDPK